MSRLRPPTLEDRFETTDGSRPDAPSLDEEIGRAFPLHAFRLLETGDAFDPGVSAPPADGRRQAQRYVEGQILFRNRGRRGEDGLTSEERVQSELCRQLGSNPTLVKRLERGRPIQVDLIPPGQEMSRYGYPRAVSRSASGVFWDHPSWQSARIAFRQEKLETEPLLVVHEMAHAIQALAFTHLERETLYRLLLRTYRSHAAADEVFAIYSEREFTRSFRDDDLRAPGVYGRTRQRWSEDHLLTRFVRNLYFPHKPLAGPGLGQPTF
jgi:hypothetical protein